MTHPGDVVERNPRRRIAVRLRPASVSLASGANGLWLNESAQLIAAAHDGPVCLCYPAQTATLELASDQRETTAILFVALHDGSYRRLVARPQEDFDDSAKVDRPGRVGTHDRSGGAGGHRSSDDHPR